MKRYEFLILIEHWDWDGSEEEWQTIDVLAETDEEAVQIFNNLNLPEYKEIDYEVSVSDLDDNHLGYIEIDADYGRPVKLK